MNSLPSYRFAEAYDLPHIQSIFNHYILNSYDIYDTDPRDEAYMQDWWNAKVKNEFPVYIAEYNGEIIGFASYGPFRRWDAYRTTVEHSVYITEGEQTKGIGSKLMELLLNEAKKSGYHAMIGGIDSTNSSSIAFHQKQGFKVVGRIPEVANKKGKWLELILMQKII